MTEVVWPMLINRECKWDAKSFEIEYGKAFNVFSLQFHYLASFFFWDCNSTIFDKSRLRFSCRSWVKVAVASGLLK